MGSTFEIPSTWLCLLPQFQVLTAFLLHAHVLAGSLCFTVCVPLLLAPTCRRSTCHIFAANHKKIPSVESEQSGIAWPLILATIQPSLGTQTPPMAPMSSYLLEHLPSNQTWVSLNTGVNVAGCCMIQNVPSGCFIVVQLDLAFLQTIACVQKVNTLYHQMHLLVHFAFEPTIVYHNAMGLRPAHKEVSTSRTVVSRYQRRAGDSSPE